MATSPPNGAPAPPASPLLAEFGPVVRKTDDPAWQAPRDPLNPEAAKIIRREIPISVVATGWDVAGVRAAREQAVLGLFDQSSQMIDAVILTDARTQAGLAARLSILGRRVEFRLPPKYRDSELAKECLRAFVDAWPEMTCEPVMSELQRWAVMGGFGIAQNLWDFSGDYAIPHPLPWHPRYVYYHWLARCFVAVTLDGQEPIIPGDSSWILHAPHGEYRGWMRGAAYAIAPWWLGRAYGLRDWMRYSEKHGLPMLKYKHPSVGDPYQAAFLRTQLSQLGQEAVFDLPQNPPPALSHDIELLEAKDTAHEGFRMLIEQCNQEITLALLAQTLTSSMPAEGGSSYAAARVHAGVLQGLMEADARALAFTVYQQISRPFARINFGNADLAPRVVWDVTPYEDARTKAQTFQSVAAGMNTLREAGLKPRDAVKLFREFGLDVGALEAVEPLQIEAQAARAGAKVPGEAAPAEGGKPNARMRIAQFMSRIDPRIVERARIAAPSFFDGEGEGLREALAEIEAAHTAPKRAWR